MLNKLLSKRLAVLVNASFWEHQWWVVSHALNCNFWPSFHSKLIFCHLKTPSSILTAFSCRCCAYVKRRSLPYYKFRLPNTLTGRIFDLNGFMMHQTFWNPSYQGMLLPIKTFRNYSKLKRFPTKINHFSGDVKGSLYFEHPSSTHRTVFRGSYHTRPRKPYSPLGSYRYRKTYVYN